MSLSSRKKIKPGAGLTHVPTYQDTQDLKPGAVSGTELRKKKTTSKCQLLVSEGRRHHAGVGQATRSGREGADKTTMRKDIFCAFLDSDQGIFGMQWVWRSQRGPRGFHNDLEDAITGDPRENKSWTS